MIDTLHARRRRDIRIFLAYLAAVATVDAGAYLGLLPTRIARLPYYDTVLHFVFLGGLALVTHRALGRRTVGLLGWAVPLGPLVVALLAALEEALQRFSPQRSSSWSDLAANVTGVVAFTLLDRWLERRDSRRAA